MVAPGQTSAVSVCVLLTVPLALESFFALFKRTSTQVTDRLLFGTTALPCRPSFNTHALRFDFAASCCLKVFFSKLEI